MQIPLRLLQACVRLAQMQGHTTTQEAMAAAQVFLSRATDQLYVGASNPLVGNLSTRLPWQPGNTNTQQSALLQQLEQSGLLQQLPGLLRSTAEQLYPDVPCQEGGLGLSRDTSVNTPSSSSSSSALRGGMQPQAALPTSIASTPTPADSARPLQRSSDSRGGGSLTPSTAAAAAAQPLHVAGLEPLACNLLEVWVSLRKVCASSVSSRAARQQTVLPTAQLAVSSLRRISKSQGIAVALNSGTAPAIQQRAVVAGQG